MDRETVEILESKIEDAIADALQKLGPKSLPLRPDGRTLHLMAKAAVTVYEASVETHP